MALRHQSEDRVVIGIDFGTTYSGVAWAYSGEPDVIELVTSWEAQLNHCSNEEKAPTKIFYGTKTETTTWGYAVPPDKDALKWFKLLLLDEKDVPKEQSNSTQFHEARRLRRQAEKDPVEIVGCYLRNIWNHSIDSIKRELSADLLQKCKFHVVITLPAIWPPYAQQRMRRAAQLSGILNDRGCGKTNLHFISEPEAAALATIRDLSKRSNIKPGDTLVVCDAGGGTVDLISYVIETVEPFVVKECVKGSGDLCGGVFLDEQFMNLIKKKVTPAGWKQVDRIEEQRFLNDGWEHGIKPQFENQPRTWLVDLPDGCSLPSENGKKAKASKGLKRRKTFELSSQEILSVFDPIIGKIEQLVDGQVNAVQKKYKKLPKYIILVGGFGRSRYLFNRLEQKFSPQTAVLQSRGNKPWSAICRGAVVQGLTQYNLSRNLEIKVESRISRVSFGVEYSTDWDEDYHRESDKYWDEYQQMYKAGNQMEWFLNKGDDMSDLKPVRHSFYDLYSEPPGTVDETIYYCSGSAPSTRDKTVSRFCTIKWNQAVSLESLPTWTNKIGKVYHELKFEIEMTCEAGMADFTIYFQGKRVGGRNVKVQFN